MRLISVLLRDLSRSMAHSCRLLSRRAASEPGGAPAPPAPASIEQVAPPLANLVRTVISVAVNKAAIHLIPEMVKLQCANSVDILGTSKGPKGLHQYLDAAANVLRASQNERLRAGGVLSTMGDGSNDRPNTEQEVIYIRYPVSRQPISESLKGLRFNVEFFDLLPVDVTFSADKKSFDACAILRSTYHTSFLQRGLASLPAAAAPAAAAPAAAAPAPAAAAAPGMGGRAQRRATHRPDARDQPGGL